MNENILSNDFDKSMDALDNEAKKMEDTGRHFVEAGRKIRDVAKELRAAKEEVIEAGIIEEVLSDVERASAEMAGINDALVQLVPVSDTTSSDVSSGLTLSITQLDVRRLDVGMLPWGRGLGKVVEVATSSAEYEKTIARLRKLQLDVASSERELPSKQIKTAFQAINAPSLEAPTAAGTILPMRSALFSIRTELLRLANKRQKSQKPMVGKGDKEIQIILHILDSLGIDGISEDAKVARAQRWSDIYNNHLHKGKYHNLTRDVQKNILKASILFLDSVLAMLDPRKLDNSN